MSTTIAKLSESVAADGCPAAITDQGVRDQIEQAVDAAGGGPITLVDASDGMQWIAERKGGQLSLAIGQLPAS